MPIPYPMIAKLRSEGAIHEGSYRGLMGLPDAPVPVIRGSMMRVPHNLHVLFDPQGRIPAQLHHICSGLPTAALPPAQPPGFCGLDDASDGR